MYYVYTLAYPDGRVFYVGKGKRQRIDAHEREARRGVQSRKCDIIRAIWADGGQVVKTKVSHFPTAEEALRHEHFLLSTYPDLANEQPGEGRFSAVALSPEDQQVFGASIRHVDERGVEYWSAREMANFLGYSHWRPFQSLVARVERGLTNAGIDATLHFQHTEMCVILNSGKGAERSIDDVRLSRFGFLLMLQNADHTKALVAYGKNYVVQCMLRAAQEDWSPIPVQDIALLAHAPRQKLQREP